MSEIDVRKLAVAAFNDMDDQEYDEEADINILERHFRYALAQQAESRLKANGPACEVCFTSSWEPGPSDGVNTIGPDNPLRCGFCWLMQQIEKSEKACNHWFEEANRDHNDLVRATSQAEQQAAREAVLTDALRGMLAGRESDTQRDKLEPGESDYYSISDDKVIAAYAALSSTAAAELLADRDRLEWMIGTCDGGQCIDETVCTKCGGKCWKIFPDCENGDDKFMHFATARQAIDEALAQEGKK